MNLRCDDSPVRALVLECFWNPSTEDVLLAATSYKLERGIQVLMVR